MRLQRMDSGLFMGLVCGQLHDGECGAVGSGFTGPSASNCKGSFTHSIITTLSDDVEPANHQRQNTAYIRE